MRFLFGLFLLCQTCLGQGFLSFQVPDLSGLPANSKDIPANIGLVISNRWMSISYPTNTAVTNWVDVTNSFSWTHANDANAPTNSSLYGVHFNGTSQFLDSTNVFNDLNLVIFFIYNVDGVHVNNYIFGDAADGTKHFGIVQFAGPTWHYNDASADYGPLGQGLLQDVEQTHTGGNSIYTNGVLATLISGSGSANFGTTSFVGKDHNNNFYAGFLKEVIIYTNKTITASQASNLNYYATHYPF